MNKEIQDILTELYRNEPGLKKYHKELEKTAEAILAARPKVTLAEEFRAELRRELMKKAQELSMASKEGRGFFELFFEKKMHYALGALILVAVLSVPFAYTLKKRDGITLISPGVQIAQKESRAFGDFSRLAQADGNAAGEDAVKGFGGGGGRGSAESMMIAPGMPAPEIVRYEFSYSGDVISIDSETMPVLRRTKAGNSSSQLASVLQGVDFGIIDLSTFSRKSVQNISFFEDSENGYMVSVNMEEGTIFINEYYRGVGVPEMYRPVEPQEVPDDATLIAIADAFIGKHGISLDGYGDPEVNSSWRTAYAATSDKENFYIPEIMQVTYPLLIDGRAVYEEGGGIKTGLMVGINIRKNRVSSVNGLSQLQFESSQYPIVSDMERVLEIAETGGRFSYLPENPSRTVTFQLSEPELAYMRTWDYSEGRNTELYVPALVFPVVNETEEYFYKENVVVPLVEDFLREGSDGPVRIMPLMEDLPDDAVSSDIVPAE